MNPTTLCYVRHAQSESNAKATAQEKIALNKAVATLELTEQGRAEARQVGERLRQRQERFDAVYISTYARSRDTLAEMFPDVPRAIECSLLDEAYFGYRHYVQEETLTRFREDGLDTLREVDRATMESRYHHRAAGGENFPDIEQRVRMFLMEIADRWAGKRVLAIGHGFWNLALHRVVRDFPIADLFDKTKRPILPNCSIDWFEGTMGTSGHGLFFTGRELAPDAPEQCPWTHHRI